MTETGQRKVKITVIGIGNELAADDGAGIEVIRRLKSFFPDPRVQYVESQQGGMEILDHIEGCEHAFLVDAACSGQCPPGSIARSVMRAPFPRTTPPSLHTLGVDGVLSLGSMAGMQLPDEVVFYTVEAADVETFGAGRTQAVTSAVPTVAAQLEEEILSLLHAKQ